MEYKGLELTLQSPKRNLKRRDYFNSKKKGKFQSPSKKPSNSWSNGFFLYNLYDKNGDKRSPFLNFNVEIPKSLYG